MRAPHLPPSATSPARGTAQDGFTLIEVLVATLVLSIALFALLGVLDVSNRSDRGNRVREMATSLAREAIEDARSLTYSHLTPTGIPADLVPMITGDTGTTTTAAGSTLTVTRAGYTFTASFTACALDDPSDGYGNHSSPPDSGGSWCPDVAPSGTADSEPDDMRRVSVTVSPAGASSTSTVQQTVLIYAPTPAGPAVSCLTVSTCPGVNQSVTLASTTSLAFNVTTTSPASSIQWLVNGNPPPAAQIAVGQSDPYTPPTGTLTSSFTWTLPQADGTYTISAVAFDANGHSGTRSSVQVMVNRHQVIAPTTLSAGWNNFVGGVDVQWVPSIDQDVQYYVVFHKVGTGSPVAVPGCTHVTGTSCTDMTAASPAAPPTCLSPPQSYTASNIYWVVGVDADPVTGLPRQSALASPTQDANLCDHPPSPPTGLTGSLAAGQLTLNWTAPGAPGDVDPGDSISAWRVYRWPSGSSISKPGSRLQLVGNGGGVTSAIDVSPDPGGVTQTYCVTAVDTHLNESACSNPVTG